MTIRAVTKEDIKTHQINPIIVKEWTWKKRSPYWDDIPPTKPIDATKCGDKEPGNSEGEQKNGNHPFIWSIFKVFPLPKESSKGTIKIKYC